MGHSHLITITGEVTDVFAHRFVVQTASGPVLADVGPKGAERLRLERGTGEAALAGNREERRKVVQVLVRHSVDRLTTSYAVSA